MQDLIRIRLIMKELSLKDKKLLLQDLCARLPYGVRVQYENKIYNVDYISALYEEVKLDTLDNYTISLSEIKPYLRPLSSMTKEEYEELRKIDKYYGIAPLSEINDWEPGYKSIDWLLKHNFDFRGLIEKGLAIEITKENSLYE